jgi:D-alanine-D-alanine ligase-like ATP-grasp enzyme
MPILSIPEVYAQSSATRIFIHAVTSIDNISVVNLNDKGASRSVLLARQNDIVVVASPVEKAFLEYLNDLKFEINPQHIVVVADGTSEPLTSMLMQDTDAFNQIISLIDENSSAVVLDTFTITEQEISLAAKLQQLLPCSVSYVGATLDVSQAVNRKDVARKLALEANVPVAPAELITDIFDNDGGLKEGKFISAIKRQMRLTSGVVVKGAVGASGSSTFVINNETDINQILQTLAKRRDNDVYLVEPLFKLSSAPNTTVWIDPETGIISLVNSTDQRLSEKLVFSGSVYPCSAVLYQEIVEASERLAKHLYKIGVKGWVGFDFVEYYDEVAGGYKFFFSEINARYNAGLYPKTVFDIIQQKQRQNGLPIPSFYITENLTVLPSCFADLKVIYQDLLFNPQTGVGVIPFNPGRLEDGLAAFICIASALDDVKQLASALRQCTR